jgi:hypothetical protein
MMLVEPSPDVYQISERAQRYVAIIFGAFFLPQTGVYPFFVNTTGGRNLYLSSSTLGIRRGRGVLMRLDVCC